MGEIIYISDVIRISGDIRLGMEFLKDQRRLGKGEEIHRATYLRKKARQLGNEQNEKYWGEVVAVYRKLESRTDKTRIIISD